MFALTACKTAKHATMAPFVQAIQTPVKASDGEPFAQNPREMFQLGSCDVMSPVKSFWHGAFEVTGFKAFNAHAAFAATSK